MQIRYCSTSLILVDFWNIVFDTIPKCIQVVLFLLQFVSGEAILFHIFTGLILPRSPGYIYILQTSKYRVKEIRKINNKCKTKITKLNTTKQQNKQTNKQTNKQKPQNNNKNKYRFIPTISILRFW